MSRNWKCTKGITLIELLIASGLVVIVLAVVFSLFIFSHNSFSAEEANYSIQNDVRRVTDYIVRTTRNATSLEIISADTGKSEIIGNELYNYIYIDNDGRVHSCLTDGAGGYNHSVLGDNTSVTNSFFSKHDNNTLRVSIEMTRDAEVYQSDVNVYLINFELSDPPSEISDDNSASKALKFKLP